MPCQPLRRLPVADAMKALKLLAVFNSVRLVWVPGHCGIESNERVDKQASCSCFTGPESSVGISTYRSSTSSWAIQEQNIRLWQALPKCRQAKLFLNTPDKCLARFALSLEKKDLRTLVGLLTGHADLNQHLKIMGLRNEAVCPVCQDEEETSIHFIAQCNATMLLRRSILGD